MTESQIEHWEVWAKSSIGQYYIGIYSGEKNAAIRDASAWFVSALKRERKPKEASLSWVYTALPWYRPEVKS